MGDDPFAARLSQVSTLGDRTRRRLYDYVCERHAPASRDEIATALGIDRSLAAYHLDKLVEHGLLTASFARPEGRGGPGAGRPAKYYARAATEVEVSVPPRDYRLVADVLARAIDADEVGAVRTAVEVAAEEIGQRLGAGQGTDAVEVLRERGYEPYRDGAVVRLRNCPFREVARRHVELICGMNLALVRGMIAAAGGDRVTAVLDPAPDHCCVTLVGAP